MLVTGALVADSSLSYPYPLIITILAVYCSESPFVAIKLPDSSSILHCFALPCLPTVCYLRLYLAIAYYKLVHVPSKLRIFNVWDPLPNLVVCTFTCKRNSCGYLVVDLEVSGKLCLAYCSKSMPCCSKNHFLILPLCSTNLYHYYVLSNHYFNWCYIEVGVILSSSGMTTPHQHNCRTYTLNFRHNDSTKNWPLKNSYVLFGDNSMPQIKDWNSAFFLELLLAIIK